jgi:hypothetical protein
VLQTNGNGVLSWVAQSGGGNGSPGGANTQIQFNNAGLFGGSASLTWDAGNAQLNTVNFAASSATIYGNIAAVNSNFTGNVTANYFIGNGSQLTGIVSNYGNANVANFLTNYGSNTIVTTGNVTAGYFLGNGSQLTGIQTGAVISNTAPTLGAGGIWWNSVDGRAYVKYGNIFIDLSPSLVPDPTTYVGNVSFDDITVTNVGNIIPAGNNAYSLGSEAFQWKDLWVSNNTIYINSIPLTLNADNVLEIDGNAVLSNDSDTSITTTGNITADYFFGNGSQLTGISSSSDELVNGDNSFVLDADGNVVFSGSEGGVNRGLVWDYGAVANGVNSQVRQDNNGLTVRAWTEVGGGGTYTASVNIVTNQDANTKTWVFDGQGDLTLAGNIQSVNTGFAFSGTITSIESFAYPTPPVITIAEEVFEGPITGQVTISNLNPSTGTPQANGTWYYEAVEVNQFTLYTDAELTEPVNTSSWTAYLGPGGDAVSLGGYTDLTIQGGNVTVGSNNGSWTFSDGNLTLPQGGVVYETSIPGGALTGTTIALKPSGGIDADQQLLIYPTIAPGTDDNHLHLTTGNLYNTELFLGNDDLYVKLANTGNVVINSNDGVGNTAQWIFGTDGVLTLPGEGILQSINDTVALLSLNTSTGNANSVYLGSSGGLGFNDQEAGGNWLEIFRSGAEPEIRVPVGRGNLNIQTAEGINAYNWTFDNTGNLTVPGHIIVAGGIVGTGASPAPTLSGFSSVSAITVSATGNVTGGNILTAGNITSANANIGNYSQDALLVKGTAYISSSSTTDNNLQSSALDISGTTTPTLSLRAYNQGSSDASGPIFKFIRKQGSGSSLQSNLDAGRMQFYAIQPTTDTEYYLGEIASFVDATGGGSVDGRLEFYTSKALTGQKILTLDSDKNAEFTGTISATGNITGGNLITDGRVSATGNIVTGGQIQSSAFTGGNIFWAANNRVDFQGAIKVGGTGQILSPGGAASITLNNNGANIPILGVTNTSNSTSTTTGALIVSGGAGVAGNVYVGGNIVGNTAGFAIGYRDIPQVSFTGNATIATADAGKHFYSTQSSNFTLTIANNASQGFQVGAAITVVNQGTGTISIAQGSGVTLYLAGNATSGNRSVATFGMATIMKVAADTWFINGTGVS